MSTPVTILMPVHNRPAYVVEALDSCLAQTHEATQVLVYDDGSTDDTPEVLFRFLSRLSTGLQRRVRVVRDDENHGQGHARRWLVQNFETPLAAWCDSDDLLPRDRLARQVAILERDGFDVVFGWLQFFNDGCRPGGATIYKIDPSTWTRDPASLRLATGTALFGRRAADLVPQHPINRGAWDVVWTMALLCHRLRIGLLRGVTYYCRRHPGRITYRKNDPELAEVRAVERAWIAEECRRLAELP